MADIVIPAGACERFPSGTVVGVWPANAQIRGGSPEGAAIATGTMTATGVTIAGFTADVPYVVYAKVGDEHRYLHRWLSSHLAGTPWKTVVADRRTAIGTS